ncbi:MAG TPA: hypothetical protein VEA58_03245 [Anaerovoracaceae bacterium]|nr:hypothetical protein [Anaerovoracaceae bacterium]
MEILNTPSYEKLIDKVKTASKIFLFGNGGLHFVASHASTDMSRLIPGKAFYSFDSVGFITSNANDHGYENLFVRWLETIITGIENPQNVLLIGLSCSGNSKNVINALQWGEDGGCSTFMISGVRSKILPQQIDELVFSECDTFHMVEVLTLMLFYDVIYKMGNFCPTISGENERKGFGSAYASK